jgi:hypothetical protein
MLDRTKEKAAPDELSALPVREHPSVNKDDQPGLSAVQVPWLRTAFNCLQFPTDIVLLVVVWRLRYTLSLRDLTEMFLVRGYEFTRGAVREWEERFAPLLSGQLKGKRRSQAGKPSLGMAFVVSGSPTFKASWSWSSR